MNQWRSTASLAAILFFVVTLFVTPICLASSDSIRIALRTNIGSVGYWFTDAAEADAKKNGSGLPEAIGPRHFPLIESLARAGKGIDGFKAYIISKVNFQNKPSFELVGVFINSDIYVLSVDGDKEIVKKLLSALSSHSVQVRGNVVFMK